MEEHSVADTSSSSWDLPVDLPEHSLKIYRGDGHFRFLLVHAETSARQVKKSDFCATRCDLCLKSDHRKLFGSVSVKACDCRAILLAIKKWCISFSSLSHFELNLCPPPFKVIFMFLNIC